LNTKKELNKPVTVRLPIGLHSSLLKEAEAYGTTVAGVIRANLESRMSFASVSLKLEEIVLALSGEITQSVGLKNTIDSLNEKVQVLEKLVQKDRLFGKATLVTIEAVSNEILGPEKHKKILLEVGTIMAKKGVLSDG